MEKIILGGKQLDITIQRLAHQLLEHHADLSATVFLGIQPRGILLADALMQQIQLITGSNNVQYGKLDITFYRDDYRNELKIPNQMEIPVDLENKQIVLIDDVLYTGRTIRAAMDAILDFGRPAKVELCVLVDRRFNRQLPIQPDYSGKAIDTIITQKVKVDWDRKEVVLLEKE